MIDEELFEFLSVLGHPLPGFEVLVKHRQREVLKADQRDSGAGISGTLGGDGHELLIEGFPAEAACKGQNVCFHRSCPFFIGHCPSNFRLYLEVSSATQSEE